MAERNSREKIADRQVECRGYNNPAEYTEKIVGADQKLYIPKLAYGGEFQGKF